MNNQIKQKWIEALRSGEYVQQRDGFLKKESEYCCLGVLCDLHRKETGKGKWIPRHKTAKDYYYCDLNTEDKRHTFLVSEVAKWAELDVVDPGISTEKISAEDLQAISCEKDNKNIIQLSHINDDGMTFEQIANLIEKYL